MEVPHKGGSSSKTELSYDPAIPLLGIYPDKTLIQKDTCTQMFIAAQFTIAKTWSTRVNKSPKCSTLVQSQKQQNDLSLFQDKPYNIHSNSSLCPKH